MYQDNMDLGVFQETKLRKRIYMRESIGYKVVAIEAPSSHSSGISIFYQIAGHFYVEAFKPHRANVVRFQLTWGDRLWYIVGCYLAPKNSLTIEYVVAAIGKRPQGAALLVVGDFNTNLAAPEGR